MTEEEFSKLAKPRSADIKIPANSETASVSATLRLDGLKWDQVCAVGVSRQPELLREGDYNGKFSLVDEKGSFSFRSLKPGIYRLTFGEAARGSAYIKSFTVDGRSASPAKRPESKQCSATIRTTRKDGCVSISPLNSTIFRTELIRRHRSPAL